MSHPVKIGDLSPHDFLVAIDEARAMHSNLKWEEKLTPHFISKKFFAHEKEGTVVAGFQTDFRPVVLQIGADCAPHFRLKNVIAGSNLQIGGFPQDGVSCTIFSSIPVEMPWNFDPIEAGQNFILNVFFDPPTVKQELVQVRWVGRGKKRREEQTFLGMKEVRKDVLFSAVLWGCNRKRGLS